MRKLGLGLDNKAFWTPSAVEDCAGSVIQDGWIITASHIKHYTGKSQVSRGDPAGQGQAGEAWSRKICEEWDSPGKRRRWQLSTDKNGVGVWPNTFTWMWDESSQVKSRRWIGDIKDLTGLSTALYPICSRQTTMQEALTFDLGIEEQPVHSVQGLDNTTAELPCQHHQVSCCFTPTSVLRNESATRRSY